MEKKGIEQIMEAFAGLKVLAKFAGAITADGKINAEDLKHLVDAAKDFQVILDGIQDIDEALAEAKDLDEAEVILIVSEAFAVFKMFKEAKADV